MVEIGGRRQERRCACRPCRSGPPVPGPVDRSADGLPQGCVRGVGHRLQGGARRAHQRRAAGHARRARGHGGDERRGPGPQPALHRRHAAACTRGCRRFRWWRPSRPTSTARFPTATATTPSPRSGRKTAGATLGLPRRQPPLHRPRTAELLGPGLRIISCHLGGSSSLCAIRDGQSVATSMGFSAAERPAAEQPRGRFRPVRPADRDEAHRQDA